jgi:hypothetical protein
MAPTSGLTAEGCLGCGACPVGRQLWVIGHSLVELGAWAKAEAQPHTNAAMAKIQTRVMSESFSWPPVYAIRAPVIVLQKTENGRG